MSRRYGSRSFPLATAAILGMLLASLTPGQAAEKRYGPGVTDTEIKIGQTMPYSGPLSGAGTVGRAELAYFEMLNEEGGINGRKVRLISLDDAFSPPKTVEQTRKLVEEEQVLAIFGTIGTAPSAAVQRYLNERKIPQLFIQSGASRLCRPRTFSMEPVDQRRLPGRGAHLCPVYPREQAERARRRPLSERRLWQGLSRRAESRSRRAGERVDRRRGLV
jgi:hypothetical protein